MTEELLASRLGLALPAIALFMTGMFAGVCVAVAS